MKLLTGISAALLIALTVVSWMLVKAHQRIGEQEQTFAQLKAVAEADRSAYEASLAAKDDLIEALREARELSDRAVKESIQREQAALERLSRVEQTLNEAIANDQSSADWADVRVPDAVIDGMHRSAADALSHH